MPPFWQGPEAQGSGLPGGTGQAGAEQREDDCCLSSWGGNRTNHTNLTVLASEAVGAAAVVLAICLPARAPVATGPWTAELWLGCRETTESRGHPLLPAP